MRHTALAFVFLIVTATSSNAAEISYRLYELNERHRTLIAEGTNSYEHSDFSIRDEYRAGKFYGVRKELPLFEGYSVGVLDTQDAEVLGFGLWVGHLPFDSNPRDFSWEWYDREEGGLFRKLQGGSRIEVSFGGMPVMQEIRTVKFLDDVEFDYITDICCRPVGDGPTHVLLIRAGSVLEFPGQGGRLR